MNLQALTKTRLKPRVGDYFAALPPDGRGYLFGRVIDVDANPLGVGGGVLIYLYKQRRAEIQAAIPKTSPKDLLVPPMITNRQPWLKGYFQLVKNEPLSSGDRLGVHCFRDVRGFLFDEKGNRLKSPSQPVGQWGLQSYRTIDDEISKALGIPLAPD